MDTNISYKGFGVQSRIAAAMPQESGSMYDSDWKLLNDVKTNYSISENKMNSYIEGELAFDYTFKPSEKFYIKPSFAVGYNRIMFSARNGYGWYADTFSYKDSNAKFYESGKLAGVDYDLKTIYTFLGSSFVFIPIDRLRLSLDVAFAPISYVEAKDSHYLSTSSKDATKYMDRGFEYFNRFRGAFSASFDITDTYAIEGAVGGIIGLPSEIPTYVYTEDKNSYEVKSGQMAGTSVQNYYFTFGVRVRVF